MVICKPVSLGYKPCWKFDLAFSSLQKCEKVNLCRLSHPLSSILLWQPKQTDSSKNSKQSQIITIKYLLLSTTQWPIVTDTFQVQDHTWIFLMIWSSSNYHNYVVPVVDDKNASSKIQLPKILKVKALGVQSCPTLWDLMDCSLPGSSIRGFFQATILEWVAIFFSRWSSWPRD